MADPLTGEISVVVNVVCWGRSELIVFISSLPIPGRRRHGICTSLSEGFFKDLKLDLGFRVVLDGSFNVLGSTLSCGES